MSMPANWGISRLAGVPIVDGLQWRKAAMLICAEIRAGAARLDEKIPGWPERIDLDRLDLKSYEECVLGQLFGDYYAGLDILGITRGAHYGFSAYADDHSPALTYQWRALITERRLNV